MAEFSVIGSGFLKCSGSCAYCSATSVQDVDFEKKTIRINKSYQKIEGKDVLTDPNLADCTAVQNRNVYRLPNKAEAWDSPVPSGILGALWLANILHSDSLSDADCAAKIDAYYETFYNFTYSEN